MFDFTQVVRQEISLAGILNAALPSRPSNWAILLLRFNNELELSDAAPPLAFYGDSSRARVLGASTFQLSFPTSHTASLISLHPRCSTG